METQGTNIFIVDDNKMMVLSLKQYLEKRFGKSVNISTFYEGESCLKNVNEHTHIIVLDYFLDTIKKNAKNGIEILKSIKKINPKTEVIMLTSNEEIGVAIDAFRAGAADYLVKDDRSWGRLMSLINKIITEPIRMMVREFGVIKFLIIFLAVFFSMGAVVYWVIYMLR